MGSDEFRAPDLSSYVLVNSSNFPLADGGFGYIHILKYDETKESSAIKNPNIQYWRIYVTFLRVGKYSSATPILVYQTTTKLNNIEVKTCTPAYNSGDGYICIMTLNNTIPTEKSNNQSITKVNSYQLGFLSTGAFLRLDIMPGLILHTDSFVNVLNYGGFLVQNNYANSSAIDYYILDDSGTYMLSWGSFGPDYFHYNQFRRNNTIIGIKKQIGNKLEISARQLLRLNDRGKLLIYYYYYYS